MEDNCKSALNFFSDQQLCYSAGSHSSNPSRRPQLPQNLNLSDLPLVARNCSNSRVSQCLLTQTSWIFLTHALCNRSLTRPNAAKPSLVVMAMCSQILGQGKRVTQRELSYKLLCDLPEYFSSQSQVNRSVQDVVALLRCSRYSLRIMASSQGLVAGCLLLQEPNQEVVDCAACGFSGHPVTGDLNSIDKSMMKTGIISSSF